MQKLQNVALRIVLKSDMRTHLYELHERCNLDTLAVRREKQMIKLCYKWVHGDGPSCLCEMMMPDDRLTRETRSTGSNPVYVPRVQTSMGERSIRYRATKCWMKTKEEYKTCTKFDQLRKKLKVVWDTFD